MADRGDRRHSYSDFSKANLDDPPNSRLFIICSKQLTEDDFRDSFSPFGDIEEIWILKDRQTGERKGVCYIKFAKTSEAAAALEAMNGKFIGNNTRQIKVMIAASRDQGAKRDINEEEKIQRLFVIVPKSMTDEELYNIFKVYGDIHYASIIKDKETRESKGFAYIKYYKFSHAAAAFEQCDRKFKAVFAEPRKLKQTDHSDGFYSNSSENSSGRPHISHSITLPELNSCAENFNKLQVIGSPYLNQDQLWKLFDIIPGMDYCQMRLEGNPRNARSVATVVYSNSQSAAYACEKLHGFEYPQGSRLIVKPDFEGSNSRGYNDLHSSSTSSVSHNSGAPKPDLLQLAETIAQATSLIQAAGFSSDLLQSRNNSGESASKSVLCNVKLPDSKPLVDIDATVAARCFIVCNQQSLPQSVLKDVFCRFGNLIDVYLLFNKNCGYAKYATRQSAENAIMTLHGAEVCGVRIKVMEAEERGDNRKRLRLDDEST